MQKIVPLGLALMLVGSLSGCITVTCPPDDRPLYDSFGREVKAYSRPEAKAMAEQNCPRTYDPSTETFDVPTDIEPSPPPGPAPTNFAPVAAVALIPLGLAGVGGNGNSPTTSTK